MTTDTQAPEEPMTATPLEVVEVRTLLMRICDLEAELARLTASRFWFSEHAVKMERERNEAVEDLLREQGRIRIEFETLRDIRGLCVGIGRQKDEKGLHEKARKILLALRGKGKKR